MKDLARINSSLVVKSRLWGLPFFLCLCFFQGWSQPALTPRELKNLSVEELMNIEVTLVSRTPEKLTEAASAIQVITGEDIRRSGATNIPDALRLASNLQVAQLSSSVWIISARGFNNVFSNKLLVMIDGRTVYTPLYGGVLWEQHHVLLEDVDRIEVVSGPGGTLWGANAVNGVINIITRNTSQAQGLYATATAGTFLKDVGSLRYGGRIGEKIHYKAYVHHFDRGATEQPGGTKNTDAWGMTQGGFRMDWDASARDAITIQGDYYDGERKTLPGSSDLNGQNLLARWNRSFSQRSDMMLQLYYDRYFREDATTDSYDKMNTADIDFQHRFGLGKRHNIVWGLGYRYVKDDANYGNAAAGIVPRFRNLDLFNSFVQDEFRISPSLRLTAGTKLLHNVYTGLEWQPNARLAWVREKGTLWGAVSRALRTPSRFDVDYFLPTTPQPPTVPSVAGGPNFVSEKLTACELGYRFQPNSKSSFSISTFYNVYDDLYSVENLPNTLTYQIQNGSEAESWGGEFSAHYQVHRNWRLRGGYTFFDKDLRAKPGRVFNPTYLGNDVEHQGLLQSVLDLPLNLQLDLTARFLGKIDETFATAAVPSYATFDARLAYVRSGFEFSVVGQNLGGRNHTEFGTFNIPRHFYAKISARF